ncbi:ovalbumin-like isoform X2 [Hippopotamus amphibius kiboko]|uniref:ovalbumin-like isoform X2 n=1 Tax=Hippopotamus amphibius kiboko TaxID=575201 RepID=UPI0025912E10|nr:ovalbumin-like isoform X2 [Hippopotamus amphibius kiboko]
MASLSAANAQFCFDVFKEINYDDTTENLFFSPLSLLSTLAMVLFGARGNSASQMEKVLHLNELTRTANSSNTRCEQDTRVHSHIQGFLSEIIKSSRSQVHMASGVFAEEAHPFLPKYLDCIEQLYKVKPQNVDFKNNLEATRTQINAWIENKTKGDIKNLLLADCLTSSDQLVLVNAISFRGTWKYAFQKDQTTAMAFRLHEVTNEITYEKLSNWIGSASMKDTAVVLYLPQLRLDGHHEDLASILTALGMTDAFDHSRADLSGITAGGGLRVSKVIHKAMLEVTESDSEFTSTNQTSKVENPEIFKVDQPFLFFILHRETKMILFYGRVCNP